MASLPPGTVTFVSIDIERSTALLPCLAESSPSRRLDRVWLVELTASRLCLIAK